MSRTDDIHNVSLLADEAAARWLARLRAHDVTEAEQAQFALWLAQDELHKAAFDRLTLLWAGLGALSTPQPVAQSARNLPRISAMVGVVMALFAMLIMQAWPQRLETVVGEQRTERLADGSTVRLNTDTIVTVRIDARMRRVTLVRGEAYFQISPDPDRPFTVATPFGTARAVGTAFAVSDVGGREMLVTVTEGQVAVAGSALEAVTNVLGPNEMARVDGSGNGVSTTTVDAESATAWRHGRLVYDGVTIAELIGDLNRYMPVRMSVIDEDLAAMRVSATLVLQDQSAMLDALEESFDLRWSAVSDQLILIRNRR